MKKQISTGAEPIAVAKCSNGQVELYKDVVRITRTGLWALLVQTFSGEVEIPISLISSVELKKGGVLNGHIRFSTPKPERNFGA